jgi:hypothetical protein
LRAVGAKAGHPTRLSIPALIPCLNPQLTRPLTSEFNPQLIARMTARLNPQITARVILPFNRLLIPALSPRVAARLKPTLNCLLNPAFISGLKAGLTAQVTGGVTPGVTPPLNRPVPVRVQPGARISTPTRAENRLTPRNHDDYRIHAEIPH